MFFKLRILLLGNLFAGFCPEVFFVDAFVVGVKITIMNIKNIYVHIPFCLRRCNYCDFASSDFDQDMAEKYLDALGVEFTRRAYGMRPETIYIGGGTPTCLSHEMIEHLVDMLDLLELDDLQEFTIEANPGTLDVSKLILLRESGITRVSLGVQTFIPEGLEVLGRYHSAKDARFAVAQLREVGFDDISIDLIFAWPGQTMQMWQEDLETVLKLGISHVSCYGLSYPQGTPISRMLELCHIEPADESLERDMFDATAEILEAGGLKRYEISNFAKPGHQCVHNLNYWRGGTYVGIGAGAHSYEGTTRFGNCPDVQQYIKRMNTSGAAIDFIDDISAQARARECAVIWLRLSEGINRELFHNSVGIELEDLLGDSLVKLLADGWLEWRDDQLCLADKSIPVADSILSELV